MTIKKALQFTYDYADLSWVKETDTETLYWLNLSKEWATANIYANKLMGGDISVLEEYVEYIKGQTDEILVALVNIMYAAIVMKLMWIIFSNNLIQKSKHSYIHKQMICIKVR
ncbi:hypothetical protein HMSSN036_67140 [Paenibacillus macerans]|nr:hypothetical protein HMSSN036_67140 [Paenibacillus macerans]